MIALKGVQLREPTCTPQFVKQLVYGGNGESIFDSKGIEGTVVHAKAPGTASLFFTKSTGEEKGLVLGCMIPCRSMVVI